MEDKDFYTCEGCGKSDETVELTSDPYALELYDEDIDMCLCPDCHHERCMDV